MGLLRIAAVLAAILSVDVAHAAPRGNQLSARAQLRYQDVLTTKDGSKWRGKIIERGDRFRIRLDDNSEVVVVKEDVATLTRELHPGYPHKGQFVARAALGVEVAFAIADENGGTQYGPMAELALGYNFGGAFEPEIMIDVTPIGPTKGGYTPQIAIGTRYYLQPLRRAKPFSTTQLVVTGAQADLGLRTGGGFLLDLTPNIGIGVSQGVTLLTQTEPDLVGLGYHALVQGQGRF